MAAGLGLYADFGDLGGRLGAFRFELFPLALALVTVNYGLRFLRWQGYLAVVGIDVPRRASLLVFAAGLSMAISPAKLGEVLKSVLLRDRYGVPVRRSAPVVLAERITDVLGLALVAALAGSVLAAGWVAALVAAAACAAALLALRIRALDRIAWLAEARRTTLALLSPRLAAAMTLLAACSWSFECLAAWVCASGLGLDVSFGQAAVVFAVGTLAGAVSLLPGGLGVAEASMTGLWRAFGAARADAAAATVLVRLATLWFAVGVGLVALALAGARRRASRGRAHVGSTEPGA